jgi:hypothetical protein
MNEQINSAILLKLFNRQPETAYDPASDEDMVCLEGDALTLHDGDGNRVFPEETAAEDYADFLDRCRMDRTEPGDEIIALRLFSMYYCDKLEEMQEEDSDYPAEWKTSELTPSEEQDIKNDEEMKALQLTDDEWDDLITILRQKKADLWPKVAERVAAQAG